MNLMKHPHGNDVEAPHKVFVEGSRDEEIDPVVIGELLNMNDLEIIEVRTMGGCDNVRSAAQALVRHHPSYYFLIDRDVQDEQTVETSWQNFPDPTTHNLLIWRKRELENYFIDPSYLQNSSYLKVTEAELRKRILEECNRRIFLDAANLTLMAIHREVGRPFAQHFCNLQEFQSEAAGAQQLDGLSALAEKAKSVADCLENNAVKQKYSEFVSELSGGQLPLQYGSGTWLERLSGKEIFRGIAGPCFKVTGGGGEILQGKVQNKEIAKGLLRLPLVQQPTDFQQLVELLKKRVGSVF
jgi:hypothetical protein